MSQDEVIKLYCHSLANRLKPDQDFLSNTISSLNNKLLLDSSIGNTPVLSPLSILYAMLIVYFGASGETKNQMKKILNLNLSDNQLITNLCSYTKRQTRNTQNDRTQSDQTQSDPTQSVKLVNSNALLIGPNIVIEKSYENKIKGLFGADIVFFKTPADAVLKANSWVSLKTNNLINKLLTIRDTTGAKMIILNTIYFKATWMNQFKSTDTYSGKFKSLSGDKNRLFMTHRNSYDYYENDNMQCIDLPYTDNRYSMRFIMPRQAQAIDTLLQNSKMVFNIPLKNTLVDLFLPKFEHRQKITLQKSFRNMGMTDLFLANKADLSLISKDGLYVGKIIHEAVVKVDEKGTEAAAVTAVTMLSTAMMNPIKPVELVLDHFFYYAIIDKSNKEYLFNGFFDG